MTSNRAVALVRGRLIDGTGKGPADNMTVLVVDGRIAATGPDGSITLPEDCQVFDVARKTVMPSLIDLHVHLRLGDRDTVIPGTALGAGLDEPWPFIGIKSLAYAQRTLDMGFTTLRDVGDMGNVAVSVRNAINAGIVQGPRIFACGQWLTATGGHVDLMPTWLQRTDEVTNVADGVDGVVKAVRRQCKMKTDWVKFYASGGVMDPEDRQEFSSEEMVALVNEAHSKGKYVAAHSIYPEGTRAALRAGVDSIEHGIHLDEEIVELMVKQGTYLVPTLGALPVLLEKGKAIGLPDWYTARMKPLIEAHRKSFRLALEAGVKIGLGTDAGFNAFLHGTNAVELQFLVAYGMSPMQALMAATSGAAAGLHMADKLGTVEPGKLADLLVVDGDPLQDITVLQREPKIALVIKDGRVCKDRNG